jgi:hypothetical protein
MGAEGGVRFRHTLSRYRPIRAIIALLLVVAVMACWVPARARHASPSVQALRQG